MHLLSEMGLFTANYKTGGEGQMFVKLLVRLGVLVAPLGV